MNGRLVVGTTLPPRCRGGRRGYRVRQFGDFGGLGIRAGERADLADFHVGPALAADTQGQRGAFRQVDATAAVRRLAVIYADDDGTAGGFIGDTHDGAERDEAMGGRHAHGIEALAAGGDIRGVLAVIPRGLTDLEHPLRDAWRRGLAHALHGDRTSIGGQGTGERMGDQSCLYEHT